MIPSVPPFEECLALTWGVSWIEYEDVVAHRGFSNAALARAEHGGISRVTATSKPTFVAFQQLVKVACRITKPRRRRGDVARSDCGACYLRAL